MPAAGRAASRRGGSGGTAPPGPAEPPPSSAGREGGVVVQQDPARILRQLRPGRGRAAVPPLRAAPGQAGRQAGRAARRRGALPVPRGAVTCHNRRAVRRRGRRGRGGGAPSRSPPPAGHVRSLQLAFRSGGADQQQPQQKQAARRRGDATGRSEPAHRYTAARGAGGGREEGRKGLEPLRYPRRSRRRTARRSHAASRRFRRPTPPSRAGDTSPRCDVTGGGAGGGLAPRGGTRGGASARAADP